MNDPSAKNKLGHARAPSSEGGKWARPVRSQGRPQHFSPDAADLKIGSIFRRMFSLYPARSKYEICSGESAFSVIRRSLARGPRSSNSWAVRPWPQARVARSFPSSDSIDESAMMASPA